MTSEKYSLRAKSRDAWRRNPEEANAHLQLYSHWGWWANESILVSYIVKYNAIFSEISEENFFLNFQKAEFSCGGTW